MFAIKSRDILGSLISRLDRNKILASRLGLIALVLLASILFAPRVAQGNRNPTYFLLALSAMVVLLIVIRWPAFSLVMVMVVGMFVPFSGPGGFNISQIGIAGLLVVWILGMLIRQKKIQLVQSRIILPLMVFCLLSLFSFALGQYTWFLSAQNAPILTQLSGFAINILSVGAFLLVAHTIDSLRKLQFLTWTFIALGSLYVVGRFLDMSWPDRIFQNGFIAGSLFWTWLFSLLVGQVFINRTLKMPIRILLVIVSLLAGYVAFVYNYDWKSGWFPALVSIAVIIFLRYWRKIWYFAILSLIPFYSLVTRSIGQEDWSWATRLEAWQIVLNIAKADPIFGLGFANYFWYTPLFPFRGYAAHFDSHSQFIDLIAQTGIMGLACFLWIFGEISLIGMRLIKRLPEGFAKAYVFGALGGIAGTLVAGYLVDWVLPFAYNIGLNGFRSSVIGWIFMGGIISIEQMLNRKELS